MSVTKNKNNDERMSFTVRNMYYTLVSIIAIFFILYIGKAVLVPLAFALLLSFIFYPVCAFWEKKGVNRLLSIIISLGLAIIGVGGVIFLFSSQIVNIAKEFGNFSNKLYELLASVTSFINNNVPFLPEVQEKEILTTLKNWASKKSEIILQFAVSNVATTLSSVGLTFIYTFLILLYRRGLKLTFVNFAEEGKKEQYEQMISTMQKVGQKYLTGMFLLILILGTLNGLGLFILGIDYGFFFGFLAGFLAIIPYIGTLIGGLIPTLYALMMYESIWYPIGVILIFSGVQFLEGNFLNPYIVGGSMNLNALIALLALIIGGALWGIPGMILFLPFTAVFRVATESYEELRPLSHLLQDDLYKKKSKSEVNVNSIKNKLISLYEKMKGKL